MRFAKLLARFVVVLAVVLPLFTSIANPAQAADADRDAQAAGRKRIVVVVREQRVYAYVGNTVVWSTRANIRGARRGTFRVQNKLPVAKSFALGWKLPHWMGIYYAGGLQNGFHGPAYTARGGRTSASLGCIVMPANAAATLYHWASVGTQVVIR